MKTSSLILIIIILKIIGVVTQVLQTTLVAITDCNTLSVEWSVHPPKKMHGSKVWIHKRLKWDFTIWKDQINKEKGPLFWKDVFGSNDTGQDYDIVKQHLHDEE